MSETKLIIKSKNKNTIREERFAALADGKELEAVLQPNASSSNEYTPRMESVGVSNYNFGSALDNANKSAVLSGARAINDIESPFLSGDIGVTAANRQGIDIKMPMLKGLSIREAMAAGEFMAGADGVYMDGNSLLEGWDSLWDARRIDLTIRKIGNPTIRELIYSMLDTPDADAIMKPQELYPHFFEFVENSGTGQSIEMGELMGGAADTMEQKIFAAGLTWDLQKELFDRTLNMSRVNDGIAIAEGGKKDEDAVAPIFNYSYSGTQQTAADTTGATREEKWYNTVFDALEDMMVRRDPITQALLDPNGCSIIASPIDAKRIKQSIAGFPGITVNAKHRPALDDVARIIGYEGERMVGRSKSVTYTDVPTGKAYMLIPNRYMLIATKRNLQLNVDRNPDVTTLSRQRMAWWYAEALYNYGIGYFVQEITLPAW